MRAGMRWLRAPDPLDAARRRRLFNASQIHKWGIPRVAGKARVNKRARVVSSGALAVHSGTAGV
ncbi:hypothetical protein GCM10010448_68170 [Streptomyces glomeratus]|uniref:Transposase n=1 Tax=Streptomyces glomeratus TaxID=284452 RepID=A0ABP6M7P5_9ACTN